LNLPSTKYYIAQTAPIATMNRFGISAGVLLSRKLGTTPGNNWPLTNISSFDIHPTQSTKILVANLNSRIGVWDTTTMTSTLVSGQSFDSKGLLCFSTTVCIITSDPGGNYRLYTFNPSNLPTLTLVVAYNQAVSINDGRGPTFFFAKNIGLLFAHEMTKITVFKTSALSTVFMSWPSATPYYVSDVYCNTTQCWHAMTQYSQPRIRSILMSNTLQDGFFGNSIPHTVNPLTTFIRSFRFFNSENLIALGHSNINEIYFYEKFLCHSECSLCIEALNSNCTAYTAPKILSNGYCCDPSCATCTGSLSTQCTSCPATAGVYFKPQTSACGTCTDAGFFVSGSNCLQCHSSCATCSINSTHCLTCNPSTNFIHIYDGNVCNSTCDTANGRYVTTWNSQKACGACDGSCKTCTGAGLNACTLCNTGFALYADKSCRACKTGIGGEYTYTTTSGVLKCANCTSPCAICKGTTASAQSCTSCTNTPMTYLNPLTATCVSCTDPGFFISDIYCLQCDTSCLTCDHAPKHCLSCSTPTDYILLYNDNACYPTCDASIGKYITTKNGQNFCGACHPSCNTCRDAGPYACTVCDPGFTLNIDGSCGVCNIGDGGEYTYLSNDVLRCSPCTSPCLTCSGTSSSNQTCLSCISGFDLNPDGTCFQITCDYSCLTCTDSTASGCKTCKGGSYLSGTSCECLPGYYRDLTLGCLQCSTSCKSCSGVGSDMCLDCNNYATVVQGNCVCMMGYYASGGSCLPCSNECRTCSTTSTTCLSCKQGATLALGSCTPSVSGLVIDSSGEYSVPGCPYSCATCTAVNQKCLSCKPNAILLPDGTCLCKEGFKLNPATGGCEVISCFVSCKTCTGPGQTDCTSCRKGSSLDTSLTEPTTGACYCSLGYGYDDAGECAPCNPACSTCSLVNKCLLCQPGFIRLKMDFAVVPMDFS
jgi:hypothetical protein